MGTTSISVGIELTESLEGQTFLHTPVNLAAGLMFIVCTLSMLLLFGTGDISMSIRAGRCATMNGCSSLTDRHSSIEDASEDMYDVELSETLSCRLPQAFDRAAPQTLETGTPLSEVLSEVPAMDFFMSC